MPLRLDGPYDDAPRRRSYTGRSQLYWEEGRSRSSGSEGRWVRVVGERDQLEYALRLPHVQGLATFQATRAAWQLVLRVDPDAGAWAAVPVDDGQTEDGRPFYVAPWFPGTLADWLRDEPPALSAHLYAAERLTIAVERLHRLPPGTISLRSDLSLGGVLCRSTPEGPALALGELGPGRQPVTAPLATTVGIIAPGHVAPERLVPGTRPLLAPSDIYSLCACVFQILSNTPRSARTMTEFSDSYRRLLTLTARTARTSAEEDELDRLRRLPLALHLEPTRVQALSPADRERFALAWRERLATAGLGAPSLVSETTDDLLQILNAGLSPYPDQRPPTAGALREVLARVHLRVAEALLIVRPATPPPPLGPPDPATMAADDGVPATRFIRLDPSPGPRAAQPAPPLGAPARPEVETGATTRWDALRRSAPPTVEMPAPPRPRPPRPKREIPAWVPIAVVYGFAILLIVTASLLWLAVYLWGP